MKKTYIKGKELALEDSIANMQDLLKSLNIEIVEKSIKNPAKNIYSIFIYAKGAKELFSNGKGSTLLAAKASALEEFCERLFNKYFFSEYYLGDLKKDYLFFKDEKYFKFKNNTLPEGLLNGELLNYYDANGELEPLDLMDFNFFDLEKGIVAIPFIEEFSKEKVYFPINLLHNLYASNGMSAGNSLEEAKVQAICEIYERYVKNEIFKNCYSLPRIELNSIKSQKIKDAISELEENGFNIIILDASLSGVFPVVSVLLVDKKSSKALASFGAHPNFEIALERTVTEALQGRGLKDRKDFSTLSLNNEAVSNPSNLEEHFINSTGLIHLNIFSNKSDFNLVKWNFEGSIKEEFEYLLNIAKERGLKVYSHIANSNKIFAYQVIIPTLSEIYEVDELVYNNSNIGAFFRETILNLGNLSKQGLFELLDNLENFEIEASMNLSKFLGISLKNDISISELKLYINLALKEYELAKELLDEILFYKDKKIYRLLQTILEIKIKDLDLDVYKNSLELFYDKDIIRALDIINAKDKLFKIDKKIKKIVNIYNNIL